jgi:DNA-binding LytR/AlgR family response regulator
MRRILAIEDNDDKFERVAAVTQIALPTATIFRARDLYEAEQAIEEEGWDLLLLDITLDLKRGGARRPGTAQDYTGGLKIIAQMYYDEISVPTVIITAFDSFPAARNDGNGAVIGLEAVEREARSRLGDLLIGTVRHGPDGWEDELRTLLDRARKHQA